MLQYICNHIKYLLFLERHITNLILCYPLAYNLETESSGLGGGFQVLQLTIYLRNVLTLKNNYDQLIAGQLQTEVGSLYTE